MDRKALFDAVRPYAPGGKLLAAHVPLIDAVAGGVGLGAARSSQAVKVSKNEAKASAAGEAGANEAVTDTTTIRNRQEESDPAAQALPDGVPDDRELRRRCRQLRDVGRVPPACRGLEGPA